MRSAYLALACVSAVALVVSPARADDRSDALIREGNALRRENRNAEALPKFEEAYRIAPTPRTAAQMGLCKQALERWVEAEELIGGALLVNDDPWINKNRALLEQTLVTIKGHVGWVAVAGEPAGAEVTVADRGRGRLPLGGPVLVDAGTVRVEVRAPGYESMTETVTVAPQAYQTVTVALKKASVAAAPAAAPAPGVALAAPPPSESRPAALVTTPAGATESERASPPVYQRVWFWGVVGGAVVAGVVAAVLLTRKTTYPDSTTSGTFP
jgi:hypothetical protein